MQLTLAGSYYDYMNLDRTKARRFGPIQGNTVVDDPDNSGKKILAYDSRVAEAMASFQFNVYKIPVSIWGDYLKNTAGDVPSDRDTAWGVGLSVGQTVEPGDWLFEYMYKRIESDSVLGLFADGDFFGTDRRGHRFMVMYQLFKKVTLELKLFDTEAIKADDSEIRLQVSTIFKLYLSTRDREKHRGASPRAPLLRLAGAVRFSLFTYAPFFSRFCSPYEARESRIAGPRPEIRFKLRRSFPIIKQDPFVRPYPLLNLFMDFSPDKGRDVRFLFPKRELCSDSPFAMMETLLLQIPPEARFLPVITSFVPEIRPSASEWTRPGEWDSPLPPRNSSCI